MGMPITIEVLDRNIMGADIENIFTYFKTIDERYSTYKPSSEISKINDGLGRNQWSKEMLHVLKLCAETSKLTHGYFNIEHNGRLDPSGLVKGWAIQNAANKFQELGARNFYIEAGGDIQAHGVNAQGQPWAVGIRSPFNLGEIVKVVHLHNQGMATSGTYIRGSHIYNPFDENDPLANIASLTVIGPNVYEADRFATAAFAMSERSISFIEETRDLEGYMIDSKKIATFTSGFKKYVGSDV